MGITAYVLVFLEGLLAFISPCILPMLPIYIMYLAGNTKESDLEPNKKRLLVNTAGFILGFTFVFVMLGATATMLGRLMRDHKMLLQRISGLVLIVFGLHYIGILKIPYLNAERRFEANTSNLKFLSSFIFGAAFSFGWTACLGTFLGSALMLASSKETVIEGMFMLFVFSMGLSVPFFMTAMIFEKTNSLFTFIKKNYKLINLISGSVLILTGAALLLNFFGYWASLFL